MLQTVKSLLYTDTFSTSKPTGISEFQHVKPPQNTDRIVC
jgi:hypothetical protein